MRFWCSLGLHNWKLIDELYQIRECQRCGKKQRNMAITISETPNWCDLKVATKEEGSQ